MLSAHSLSLRAAGILRPGVTGRVLASFRLVCDLVTDAGEVVALVGPGIGNGPLNVVLERGLDVAVPAGARFAVADQVLQVGAVEVDLSSAARWDARPDWDRLRARWGRRWFQPPADKVENLLKQVPHPPGQCASAHFGHISRRFQSVAGPAVEAAIVAFEQAWRGGGSSADLQCPELRGTLFAVYNLLGLGPGLTPAGDDWLAGWLLGQHLGGDLREPALSLPKGLRNLAGLIVEAAGGQQTRTIPRTRSLRDLADLIVEAAAERTTTLSRAFLAAAAAGEADEAWHELLDALADESASQQISKSANRQINESANQQISKSANQQISKSANQRSANQQISKSANQQISKSTNQRIGEATARIMRHGATSGAAMLAGFFSAVEMLAFTEN